LDRFNLKKYKLAIVGADYIPSTSPRAIRINNLVNGLSDYFERIDVYLPIDVKNSSNLKNVYFWNFSSKGNAKKSLINQSIFKRILLRIGFLLLDFPDVLYIRQLGRTKAILDSDIILSIGVPHSIHWGVSLLICKGRTNKTWIAESSDPFFTKGMDLFPKPFYFRILENKFLKQVNKVVVPFEGAKSAYPKIYRDKFKIIPQGFDENEFNKYKLSENKNKIFTLTYAGSLYKFGRNPYLFLTSVLNSQLEFKFNLIINNFNLIPSGCFDDKRFNVCEFIDRSALYRLLGNSDAIISFSNISETQSPSKIIEYSFLKKPIFSIDLRRDKSDKIERIILGKEVPLDYNKLQFTNEQVIKSFVEIIKNEL
jgi:hypothetical protein